MDSTFSNIANQSSWTLNVTKRYSVQIYAIIRMNYSFSNHNLAIIYSNGVQNVLDIKVIPEKRPWKLPFNGTSSVIDSQGTHQAVEPSKKRESLVQ